MMGGECFIGRAPNCALVLPSPAVSRLHAKIVAQGEHYYLIDFASKSGCRVNNEEIKPNQPYQLQLGDVVRIGEFVLLIEATPPGQAEDKAPPHAAVAHWDSAQRHANALSAPTFPFPASGPLSATTQLPRWIGGEILTRCVRVIQATPQAKILSFIANPPVQYVYQPGQSVSLSLEIDGETVLHSRAISSSPSRPHLLEITVQRVQAPTQTPLSLADQISNWLYDQLQVGSSLKLVGLTGESAFFKTASRKMLFISSGRGIAAMMSMVRWVYDLALDCDIVFLHHALNATDLLFRQELELIAACHPHFQLVLSTLQQDPVGETWTGLLGEVTEAGLRRIAPDLLERTVYLGGSQVFINSIKSLLTSLNFPMYNCFSENTGSGGSLEPQLS
jgi:ferredoxin-NADP reductase